ncbi:hypothetical protein GCK72_011726 [Caenorhabditis remanei]|uniref:Uncharacterized protein n=1 Tax=Caenorhabditis remanei TaxID=31234 RepID=A0A6A5H6K2_CAERE|nr:hypothetical protein GCK72_011726 [Caenorhabditis remanei]KAF1763460.1 hypothetical protein GCK72_011726 [Caenorhabditis remanei]
MESIKENPPITNPPPKHPSTEDQLPLVEIKVFHNELKFGSSHCLLRHQGDFFFLKKEQRIIMKDINKNYEDSEKSPEYKQGLVDQYRKDRQWYVFGNQTMMDKAVGNQEGIFIEFTEDVIESQNGIFLKLFRDDNPRWKNENDEKLKTILRNLLTSFNDIEMEKKTSQPLETGSVKKGNPKVLRSNKNNKKQDGTKEPDNKGVPPQKSIDESVLPSDLNNNARKTLDGKGSDQKRMWFHRRNKKKSHQPAKENDSLYQEQIAPEPIPLTEYQSCRKNSVIRASQLSLCSQASSTKNKSRNQRKLYYRNHIKEEKKEHDCPPIGEGSTTSKSIKSTKSSRNARVNDKKEDSTAKRITNEPNLVPETE